jgi:hypothetical protein
MIISSEKLGAARHRVTAHTSGYGLNLHTHACDGTEFSFFMDIDKRIYQMKLDRKEAQEMLSRLKEAIDSTKDGSYTLPDINKFSDNAFKEEDIL